MHGVFEVDVIFFHIDTYLVRSRILFFRWQLIFFVFAFFPHLLSIAFHVCADLFRIHTFHIWMFSFPMSVDFVRVCVFFLIRVVFVSCFLPT
jgi:hypothetical protein